MEKNLFENLKIKELKTLLSLSSNPKQFILRKKDFHKHLRFGDVICSINFTTRKGSVAKSIMKMTKSRVTHTKIYVGKGKIIDSTSHRGFVDYEKLMDMKEQILVVLRANLSPTQRKRFHGIVRRMLKRKPRYNMKGLVGYAVYRVTGFFPSWLNTKGSFFCSEFVYECFLKAGYKLGEHKNSEFVSPSNVFESKKLNIICLLDGINGIKFSRKTWDANKKIQEEAKKLLLKRIK